MASSEIRYAEPKLNKLAISAQYGSKTLRCDGVEWFVTASI